MSFFVQPPVAAPRGTSVALWRDCVIGVLKLNKIQNFIGSIGFVGKNCAISYVQMRQNLHSHSGIMYIPRRQLKVKRISKAINNRMNFGRLAATARADELVDIAVYSPFLAPALCWWAFMLVESL